MHSYLLYRQGQSFLALILLIGSIVGVVGITLAFLAGSFVDSGYGYQASAIAEAAATSGAEDALLQLNRNSSLSSYSLVVASTTAVITITSGSTSTNVLSVATVSKRVRKVNVLLAKNASTSQFSVLSWQEIQ